MIDKILAFVSMGSLIGFVAIVAIWVNEPDLWVICIGVLAMGVYEFVSSIRSTKPDTDPKSSA